MSENGTTTPPENVLSVVVNRVVTQQDNNRLKSMCSLINTFNYAIQVQGNRNTWEPSDFRSFAIALCAMDMINGSERENETFKAVEEAMQEMHSRHA